MNEQSLDVTTDLAMVSKIRVDVRGGSMEAAERVAFLMIEHAQAAGWLEGVVPHEGAWVDHHFHRPNVTRSMGDGPEDWSELGMPYAGRLSMAFTPMVQRGGFKLYGFEVTQREHVPEEVRSGEDGADVTDKVIVLDRKNGEAVHEHSWDGGVRGGPFKYLTAEEVLADIRSIHDTKRVRAESNQGYWTVTVEMDGWEDVEVRGEERDDLRPVAVEARNRVIAMLKGGVDADAGQKDDALPSGIHGGRGLLTESHMSALFTAVAETNGRPWRTLLVGSEPTMFMAQRIFGAPDSSLGELPIRIDERLLADAWLLTTEG